MFRQPSCENIDIALVDVTVKITVGDVIVICTADVDAMIYIRCYSARWQIFLPLFYVLHHTTMEFVAGYIGSCSGYGGRCYDHKVAHDVASCL